MSWRTVNLGELVDNYSVRAKDHSADTSSLEFCGVSNNEGITISKYAAEDKADDYKIIEKDCFAYNPYRINVGSIGLLESDTVGLISPAYVVFKPKPKCIIPQLLLKFLKSSEGLRQIKMHARGTVRQALRFEDLCKIELSIPDYDSQLDLFKRIEETEIETSVLNVEFEHQLSLVKQLRQAFLSEAIQGKLVPQDLNDEPASVLRQKIKAEKEQLIKEKKIKKEKPLPPISEDEIPFEIPDNWVWCRLGEIVEHTFYGPRFSNSDYVKEGIPTIRTTDMSEYGIIEMKDAPKVKLTSQSKITLYKIDYNDLLITRTGSIGTMALFKSDYLAIPSAYLIRCRFMLPEMADYLFRFLKSDYSLDYFGLNTKTGTRPNINAVSISNLIISLPPLSEQNRIVAKLDELMQMCDALEASIKESQQQNETLLQQVLREALEPEAKNEEV